MIFLLKSKSCAIILCFLFSFPLALFSSDIIECEGEHECEQECINVPGSYSCDCYPGHFLNEDRRTCLGPAGKISY